MAWGDYAPVPLLGRMFSGGAKGASDFGQVLQMLLTGSNPALKRLAESQANLDFTRGQPVMDPPPEIAGDTTIGMSPPRRPYAPEPPDEPAPLPAEWAKLGSHLGAPGSGMGGQSLAGVLRALQGAPMEQPREMPLTDTPAPFTPSAPTGGGGGGGAGMNPYEAAARKRFGSAYELIVGRAMAEAAARKDRLEARRETTPRQMRANAAYGRTPPMRNLQIMQARASGPRNARQFTQSGPASPVGDGDAERQQLAQAIAQELAKMFSQAQPGAATAYGGGGFK